MAVSFIKEEWELLDSDQVTVCKEIKQEKDVTMISPELGLESCLEEAENPFAQIPKREDENLLIRTPKEESETAFIQIPKEEEPSAAFQQSNIITWLVKGEDLLVQKPQEGRGTTASGVHNFRNFPGPYRVLSEEPKSENEEKSCKSRLARKRPYTVEETFQLLFRDESESSSEDSCSQDEDFDSVCSEIEDHLSQKSSSTTDEDELLKPAEEIQSLPAGARKTSPFGQHSRERSWTSVGREPPPEDTPAPATMRGRNGRLWYKDPQDVPQRNTKRAVPECGRPTHDSQRASISETFGLFLSEDIISIIVRETNREAERKYAMWNSSHPENSKIWKDLDETELKAYIGLLILSGLYRGKKEPLHELWSPRTGCHCFLATMSLARFRQLTSHMQFDNKETREERKAADKLAAFRDVWTLFVMQLHKWYLPGAHLTVDEQLLPFRGCCPFKQYTPSKPTKYGIKIWWCCDGATSYPVSGDIYLGREVGEQHTKQLSTLVVEELIRPWYHSGRNVVGDHFVTSVELAEGLQRKDLTYLGAIKRNKADIPKEMLPRSERRRFSSIFAFDRELSMVSYVPRKSQAVLVLSTMHHDASVTGEKKKPEILLDYDRYKNGVKNLDRLIRMATCRLKITRWPMTLFFNLVDISAICSFIVWIGNFPTWNDTLPKRRQRLFLTELGYQLIDAQIKRRMAEVHCLNKSIRAAMRALDYKFPEPISLQTEKKPGRCSVCPRALDRKTRKRCENCHRFACTMHLVTRQLCADCLK